MKNLRSLFAKLKVFDIFGRSVGIYINESPKYRSYLGAFISISIFCLSLAFLANLLNAWVHIDNATTINSTENLTLNNLLLENRSIIYDFTKSNYYIYFAISVQYPNQTILNYHQMEKYFQIEYRYADDVDIQAEKVLETEDCFRRAQNDFLLIDYDKSTVPEFKQSSFQMCLKNKIKLGLISDLEGGKIFNPSLNLEIRICQNSTKNNFGCAGEDEIKEIIPFVVIQASIPKTIYDFRNTSKPVKRMFKYEFYYLDWNLNTIVRNEMIPSFLYNDHGFFSDDYQFNSLDFNPDRPIQGVRTRKDTDKILYQYKIAVSLQNDKYYIRNQKINDLIGSFGGIINILFNLGNLICFFYNWFYLDLNLINTAFRFTSAPEKKKGRKNIIIEEDDNQIVEDEGKKFRLKVSFTSILLSKLKLKKSPHIEEDDSLYRKSRSYLNEYIDIKKIISRLQDVDKLKNVLFNDDQRYFFDLIPKPEISTRQSLATKITFGLENILKSQINSLSQDSLLRKYENLKSNPSLFSERILSYLDESIKLKYDPLLSSKENRSKRSLSFSFVHADQHHSKEIF